MERDESCKKVFDGSFRYYSNKECFNITYQPKKIG